MTMDIIKDHNKEIETLQTAIIKMNANDEVDNHDIWVTYLGS